MTTTAYVTPLVARLQQAGFVSYVEGESVNDYAERLWVFQEATQIW